MSGNICMVLIHCCTCVKPMMSGSTGMTAYPHQDRGPGMIAQERQQMRYFYRVPFGHISLVRVAYVVIKSIHPMTRYCQYNRHYYLSAIADPFIVFGHSLVLQIGYCHRRHQRHAKTPRLSRKLPDSCSSQLIWLDLAHARISQIGP